MAKAASRVRRVRSKTKVSGKRTPPAKSKGRQSSPSPTKSSASRTKRPAGPASAGRKTAQVTAFTALQFPKGVLLGAHTSTAGGLATAIQRAQTCGFTAAQLFVKNNKQWFAPPLAEDEARLFREARGKSGIRFFAHNSYLINLASQDPEMFSTSVKAMIAEVERAEALELPFIVMHPGSHGGAGEEAGLARMVEGLNLVMAGTAGYGCRLALEVTAGQGKSLGHRLEHLTHLIENVWDETRAGICLDTAHLFAAGYKIHERAGYESLVSEVEKQIGLSKVLALHLNDSKVPLGARVDRHDHLGEGHIGLGCFTWIVSDPRWAHVPKVLETPKGEDMREDVVNLNKLASYLQ